MITTTALIKTIGAIGATITAVLWVPDAADAARHFVSEPIMEVMEDNKRAQTILMASMKHYDVRTDELAADVRTKSTNIRDKEKYIEDNLSETQLSPGQNRTRMFLENQIKTDRKEMDMKIRLLNEALGGEARLLQMLSRA